MYQGYFDKLFPYRKDMWYWLAANPGINIVECIRPLRFIPGLRTNEQRFSQLAISVYIYILLNVYFELMIKTGKNGSFWPSPCFVFNEFFSIQLRKRSEVSLKEEKVCCMQNSLFHAIFSANCAVALIIASVVDSLYIIISRVSFRCLYVFLISLS